MKILNNIDDTPKQNMILIGENGEKIPFYLYYAPSVQTWFFDITYKDTTINGCQLNVGPNILRNYRNNIPFGLGCTSTDGLEPYYLTDFLSGRVSIYLLSSDDVESVEVYYN